MVDALDQAGRLDNTVIVLTSDNGWFFGEHRLTGKEHPFEEAIRVPLIVRGPGVAQGLEAQQLVLNNDLAPTLADFAGAVPPYAPDGMSLLPVLGDPLVAAWPRKTFLVEHWFRPSFLKYKGPTQFALRSIKTGQDYLYTLSHADPSKPGIITGREFYHLPTDPHQMKALALPVHIAGILDQLVSFFRICQADSCHFFESF